MNNNRLFVRKAAVTLVFAFLLAVVVRAQKPEITAVDKKSGSLEEIVTIKGSNFGTNPANLSIYFGAEKAPPPTTVSDQLIEVKVPGGTTFQHVSVTNLLSKLTGYSQDPFLISFGGSFPFNTTNLGAEQQFASPTDLYDHCLCDFNNDGLVDMASANRGASDNISIFRNTSTLAGAINFAPATNVVVGTSTLQVKCGDLNGDGRADLVATDGRTVNDTKVYILQNNGAFAFTVQSVTLIKFKTSKIEIADIDGDGKPEVLVGDQFVPDAANPNKPAQIAILVNTSNGAITFGATVFANVPKGTSPDPAFQSTDAIVAQDLNGDNRPDLVTTQYGAAVSNIAIIPNTSVPGAISFGPAIKLPKFNDQIRDIRVGDLDGDGKPDIGFTGVSGKVAFARNTTTGSSISFTDPPLTILTPLGTWGIDFGDVDGDSKIDVLSATVRTTGFVLLNNQSTPGNLSFTNQTIPTEFVTRHVRVGDLNGDGKPDISVSSVNSATVTSSKISVFRNNSCPLARISPAATPVRLCSAILPYKLTAPVAKNAYYQWLKDGVALACGQNMNTFDVTAATGNGNYTVKVFSGGATGCATPAACVNESDPINITIVAAAGIPPVNPTSNSPVCIGSVLNLDLLNSNAGETYKWSGPEGFTATGKNPTLADFRPAMAGDYEVEVTLTAGNCVVSKEIVTVQAKDVTAFQITPAGSVTACEGEPAKVLTVANVAGYSYQWKKDNVNVGTNSNTYSVPSVLTSTGDYTVTAQSGSCLPTTTAPVKVTVVPLPAASFTMLPAATACAGEKVKFTAANNVGDADYAWDFGDGKTSTDQNPEHIYTSDNGGVPYSVTLTVSFGGSCPDSDNKNITITAAPTMTVTSTAPDYDICPGETITLSIPNTFTDPVWSNGSTDHSISVGEGGVYSVTAKAANGCVLTDDSDEVNKLPTPGIIISADPQQINEGGSSQLIADGLEDYTWTPEESLSATNIENPIANPTVTTTYTVTGKDTNGCTGTATIQISVLGEAIVNKLEPKNFMSPNNSGHNDVWTIDKILDFPQCEVTIYDDKGVKVFSAKPYQNDWNGVYNGKELPDGVYFYVIRCEGEENSPRTGSITLIR
jgi:gliding motility-associated-like protein